MLLDRVSPFRNPIAAEILSWGFGLFCWYYTYWAASGPHYQLWTSVEVSLGLVHVSLLILGVSSFIGSRLVRHEANMSRGMRLVIWLSLIGLAGVGSGVFLFVNLPNLTNPVVGQSLALVVTLLIVAGASFPIVVRHILMLPGETVSHLLVRMWHTFFGSDRE